MAKTLLERIKEREDEKAQREQLSLELKRAAEETASSICEDVMATSRQLGKQITCKVSKNKVYVRSNLSGRELQILVESTTAFSTKLLARDCDRKPSEKTQLNYDEMLDAILGLMM